MAEVKTEIVLYIDDINDGIKTVVVDKAEAESLYELLGVALGKDIVQFPINTPNTTPRWGGLDNVTLCNADGAYSDNYWSDRSK